MQKFHIVTVHFLEPFPWRSHGKGSEKCIFASKLSHFMIHKNYPFPGGNVQKSNSIPWNCVHKLQICEQTCTFYDHSHGSDHNMATMPWEWLQKSAQELSRNLPGTLVNQEQPVSPGVLCTKSVRRSLAQYVYGIHIPWKEIFTRSDICTKTCRGHFPIQERVMLSISINAAMPWFIITFSFITTLAMYGYYTLVC